MSHARTALLVLAAWAGSSACAAATLDECPARKYKPCASFTTSRTINEHTLRSSTRRPDSPAAGAAGPST